MVWWIVGSVLVLFFVILPLAICIASGLIFGKVLKKNKDDLMKGPKMDISFYENSPHKKAAKIGREYLDTNTCEIVDITSKEGFKLHGWYYPAPNGNHKKILLGMHGFKSAGRMEYAPYAEFYHSIGFDLLLVDQRAHGQSEGKYCTMGVLERFDALSWLDFIINKFGDDVKILMHGVSMGAATVCCVSGEKLPKQVIGIISDCAYATIKDEISFQLNKVRKTPDFPIVNSCELYCKMFARFDFKTITPEKQVAKATVPMLFVHGDKDCIVPPDSVNKLYNACSSKKKLLIVENANHAESIAIDPEAYHKAIRELFNV